jgi:hypothetical protein
LTYTYSIVVASNDERLLRDCLFRSPALQRDIETLVERSATSAASAYNAGTQKARGDIVVYAHQDVLLPDQWFNQLSGAIMDLDAMNPSWGVLGVLGVDANGVVRGTVYSSGLGCLVGIRPDSPAPVRTLDEVVLVVRRAAGLKFDEALPGFHLYGTDLCLEAARRGLSCYAIDAGCVHNSNGIALLPLAFWRSWFYIRRKWRSQLPVLTPCMPVTRWGLSAMRYLGTRVFHLLRFGRRIGTRADDARDLLGYLPR